MKEFQTQTRLREQGRVDAVKDEAEAVTERMVSAVKIDQLSFQVNGLLFDKKNHDRDISTLRDAISTLQSQLKNKTDQHALVV